MLTHYRCSSEMEHATGVEPAYSAWEANVLPMNYACVFKLYERSLSFVN